METEGGNRYVECATIGCGTLIKVDGEIGKWNLPKCNACESEGEQHG